LQGAELLILDNLSTLCRGGKENEAESWLPVQAWALSLRRRGVSVLFVHHAGKGGAQRGTSRREDVLDTVINLRHGEDYSAIDGARFEVHYEKARGIHGEDARPFEARMESRDGAATWTMQNVIDPEMKRAADLSGQGLSMRDIGEELGVSKSKAQRLCDRARREGLIDG
jgi:putative DNA primase/helicase